MTTVTRESSAGGKVTLKAGKCVFEFTRRAPGVLEVRIEGTDKGQFGTAALDEIALAIVRERPIELFVDASRASMPAVAVSQEWTRFFSLNRKDLKRVSVLVSSRSVELTVAIAQHLSRTGNLIQIYSDPSLFEARKGR
ncbi:MAG TPA: hypothetical protein VM051_09860 [Usitatibacter sp.]|nr:hypothetical protein [Usitatibacter sp.]